MSQVKQGIDRRAFNRLMLSSMAVTSAASEASVTSDRRHIAVIGAGIVGSSIAYNLAKQGARVTLIDRSKVGGATSHGTFAWINATWAKQPRHYHAFNQLGIEAWHRLQKTSLICLLDGVVPSNGFRLRLASVDSLTT